MKNKIVSAVVLGALVGCGGDGGAPSEPEPTRQIEGRWAAQESSREVMMLQVSADLSCRATFWDGYEGEKIKVPCTMSVKPDEAEIVAGQAPAVYRLAEAYSFEIDGHGGSLHLYVDDEDGEEFAGAFEPEDSIFDLDDSFRFDRVPDPMPIISAMVMTNGKWTAEQSQCVIDVFAGASADLKDVIAEIYDERFYLGPESLLTEMNLLQAKSVAECGVDA